MKTAMILLTIVFLIPIITNAKMYKWVDDNGVTHFSNVAPPKDQKVETKTETEGDPAAAGSSQGLEKVLKSYRRDSIQDRLDSPRSRRSSTSRSAKSVRDYERWAEKLKRDVAHWEQRLHDAQRESYSNKQKHENKIRHCEKMLADYKSMLKDAERNLREAR